MALREALMVKSQKGPGIFALTPKTGESIVIKSIKVSDGASPHNFVTLKIDKTTVGYFKVGGVGGNHLHFPLSDKQYNLLDELRLNNVFIGYPVAEGETFYIEGIDNDKAVVQVEYEVYDSADVKREQENGSASTSYLVVNYGIVTSNINRRGEYRLDYSLLPAEFPDFPFGVPVPAKTTIQIYAIGVLSPYIVSMVGTNEIWADYLKLIRDRVVLFDEDRLGFSIDGRGSVNEAGIYLGIGNSVIGFSSSEVKQGLLWFPEPLIFDAGEELFLNMVFNEIGTGNVVDPELTLCCVVMKVVRGE